MKNEFEVSVGQCGGWISYRCTTATERRPKVRNAWGQAWYKNEPSAWLLANEVTMTLLSMLGLRDTINGKSLPAYMHSLDERRRAKAADERVQKIITEATAEQELQDDIDRVTMLAKVRARQRAIRDEPDDARRRRIVDKLDEAEIQLHRTIK